MKIFILSPNKDAVFTPELLDRLSSSGEVIVEMTPKPFDEVKGLLDSSDKIIAADPDFFKWNFPKEIFDRVVGLKAVCLQTTSFSWVDTAYAKEKGIPVTNLRGFSTEAVAEYAFLMTLGAARKISLVIKDDFKQDFVKDLGIELKGKTAGIIGMGRIGKRFAEICEGFGMHIIYWSKNSRVENWKFLELAEVVRTADVIFPALAKNDETAKLLTDELLKSMKKSSLFVSVVHSIYNHDLVLEMVGRGNLYGYAFEEKDANPNNFKGNVLALPSIAWATDGSMRTNGEMWANTIISATKGEFPTKVN